MIDGYEHFAKLLEHAFYTDSVIWLRSLGPKLARMKAEEEANIAQAARLREMGFHDAAEILDPQEAIIERAERVGIYRGGL